MKTVFLRLIKFFLKLFIPLFDIKFKCNKSVDEIKKKISNYYIPTPKLFSIEDIEQKEGEKEIDLSIIIPVYNSEKFLEKCLKSVVMQKTKYKYEVILINDGSTDNSLNIIEEYYNKYKKIIKIINQPNKGISGARNTGINNATGKYIGFIDNDDIVREDYVEVLLDRAYKSNADIVKCNFISFNSVTNKMLKTYRNTDKSISGYMKNEILNYNGYIWGGIYIRSLWKDIRFPVGYWYEDMITRMIIYRKCKQFEYVDKDLYFYNVHGNNASKILWNKGNIKSLDQYFLVKKLKEYSKKIGIEEDETLYKIILWEYGPMLYLRTRKLNKKIKKDIFILCCDDLKDFKKLYKEDFKYRYLQRSFLNNNWFAWKMISLYCLIDIKLSDL